MRAPGAGGDEEPHHGVLSELPCDQGRNTVDRMDEHAKRPAPGMGFVVGHPLCSHHTGDPVDHPARVRPASVPGRLRAMLSRVTSYPSAAEADAIAGHPDPTARNLRITQAYYELSTAVASLGGLAANWCTFATWASKQAGQTIRREDLERAIEDKLGRSEAFTHAVARIRAVFRALRRRAEEDEIAAALREACLPARALDEASDAVARGNRKVFEEIGREFARFLPLVQGGTCEPAILARFCADLRPGPPPDGQDLLRDAFRGYAQALATGDAKARAELVLLANLRIGLHEQTRLQPEIAEALNAPVPEPAEVKERLFARLLPERGGRLELRVRLDRSLDLRRPLDEAVARLLERLRVTVRMVITEALVTLALPGGTLRLGADLVGTYPAHLQNPANTELVTLLGSIDPNAGGPRGSGAEDWASLTDRMHYIGELFRLRQEDPGLLSAPFTLEQTVSIKEGRMPVGRL